MSNSLQCKKICNFILNWKRCLPEGEFSSSRESFNIAVVTQKIPPNPLCWMIGWLWLGFWGVTQSWGANSPAKVSLEGVETQEGFSWRARVRGAWPWGLSMVPSFFPLWLFPSLSCFLEAMRWAASLRQALLPWRCASPRPTARKPANHGLNPLKPGTKSNLLSWGSMAYVFVTVMKSWLTHWSTWDIYSKQKARSYFVINILL